MSRIGKKPVVVPAGVEVTVDANNVVTVKGPKGQLSQEISKLINVEVADGVINVTRSSDHREHRSQHGLSRTLINNMVVGVTEGFEKKLQLVGVGYKAEKKGNTLVLNLGYSHPVELVDPEGITTECPSATDVVVKGIDKAFVGTMRQTSEHGENLNLIRAKVLSMLMKLFAEKKAKPALNKRKE